MDQEMRGEGRPAAAPAVHCAHDALVAIDAIVPNPRNPNRHPARQVTLLARVIAEHGWRVPLTVSTRSGHLVRGHGRLAAARELGLTEVPVDYQDYPDEEGELADMVADNRIPEIAETDAGALEDVLAELRDGGYDLLDAGFDEDALATLFAWQPDESAMPDPLPPPPVAGEDTRNVRVQVVCRSPEEVELVHRALRVPSDRASQCVFAATDVLKWMEAPA